MNYVMKLRKRVTFFVIVTMLTSLLVTSCGSTTPKPKGQYPSQNINGIIAWGAGGGTDNVSRRLQPVAEKVLGKSIIMSNKTGGSGTLATQYVYDKRADGYTLLFNAENPLLYPILGLSKLTYDDFEPILISVQGNTVIVVPKDSPYNTLDDLIKDAKAKPGKINLGISGVGGQPYITAAILKKVEGVEFNQVPFDGDGPLTTALLGKQVQVTALSVGAAAQYIKNGDMKALALMANEPNVILPNVPAIGEINPAYQKILKASGFFFGVFVKKGTPEDVVEKLREAFQAAYNDPKFQEYIITNGMIPLGLTGNEAKKFVKEWQSQISWLIYEAGGAKESPEKFGIPKPQ